MIRNVEGYNKTVYNTNSSVVGVTMQEISQFSAHFTNWIVNKGFCKVDSYESMVQFILHRSCSAMFCLKKKCYKSNQ